VSETLLDLKIQDAVDELLDELGEEEPPCESAHNITECSGKVTHRSKTECLGRWMNICQNSADHVIEMRKQNRDHVTCGEPVRECWHIHAI
jgi:hypothetical protein